MKKLTLGLVLLLSSSAFAIDPDRAEQSRQQYLAQAGACPPFHSWGCPMIAPPKVLYPTEVEIDGSIKRQQYSRESAIELQTLLELQRIRKILEQAFGFTADGV